MPPNSPHHGAACGLSMPPMERWRCSMSLIAALARIVACGWLLAAAAPVHADAGSDLGARVQELVRRSAPAMPDVRVEVEVGAIDPRLQLAPCVRVTPYLPPNTRLWGAARVGVRCDEGARWNVYLPLRVRVWARSTVLTQDLPAGTLLEAAHLAESAMVDLAAAPGEPVRREADALGRVLARALRRGDGLRRSDLKPRQWFAAGEPVRVHAVGSGFTVLALGEALVPGVEGGVARVRLDGGRVVSGRPTGPRQLELRL